MTAIKKGSENMRKVAGWFYRLRRTELSAEGIEYYKVRSDEKGKYLIGRQGLFTSRLDVEDIRKEVLPQLGASDLHRLAKLRGIRSMTLVAELILRASLIRTESRASHYREDYPERDDEAWLKWIMASQKNGKLNFRLEPVPLAEYKHKTWHCYSDNFEFPRQDLANRATRLSK